MPKLDHRLQAVATRIQSNTHADIGSDHGHLLLSLLAAGRIRRGIAIENKSQPFENSLAALQGRPVDVRMADGLEGLRANEADSLSICGMGGESIVKILDAFPDRVPDDVILQPNRNHELVRDWGLRRGYHLIDECVADGNWSHLILQYLAVDSAADPAYEGLDRDAALLFGPWFLRRRSQKFVDRLRQERDYLKQLDGLDDRSANRLAVIERLL